MEVSTRVSGQMEAHGNTVSFRARPRRAPFRDTKTQTTHRTRLASATGESVSAKLLTALDALLEGEKELRSKRLESLNDARALGVQMNLSQPSSTSLSQHRMKPPAKHSKEKRKRHLTNLVAPIDGSDSALARIGVLEREEEHVFCGTEEERVSALLAIRELARQGINLEHPHGRHTLHGRKVHARREEEGTGQIGRVKSDTHARRVFLSNSCVPPTHLCNNLRNDGHDRR